MRVVDDVDPGLVGLHTQGEAGRLAWIARGPGGRQAHLVLDERLVIQNGGGQCLELVLEHGRAHRLAYNHEGGLVGGGAQIGRGDVVTSQHHRESQFVL
jgi:hypothetical protein